MKDDILKRGYPKKCRSEPRTTVAIDVQVADNIELHNRFDLLTRLLSGDDCNDDDYNSECSNGSVCSNDSESDISNGSERFGEDVNRDKTGNQSRVNHLTEEKLNKLPPKCDSVNQSMPKGASSVRSSECLL